jgi:hypothetical protein
LDVTPDFEVINRAINHMCARIKITHIWRRKWITKAMS